MLHFSLGRGKLEENNSVLRKQKVSLQSSNNPVAIIVKIYSVISDKFRGAQGSVREKAWKEKCKT